MNTYEAEVVQCIIEELIAQIGPENVDDTIDVERALEILSKEIDNGSEEEIPDLALASDEEELV